MFNDDKCVKTISINFNFKTSFALYIELLICIFVCFQRRMEDEER